MSRERRALEEKLRNVQKLNEADDDDDDVTKWVEKNRRVVSEKEQAEKRVSRISYFLEEITSHDFCGDTTYLFRTI